MSAIHEILDHVMYTLYLLLLLIFYFAILTVQAILKGLETVKPGEVADFSIALKTSFSILNMVSGLSTSLFHQLQKCRAPLQLEDLKIF